MTGSLSFTLHILGVLAWVGGMVFAMLVLRPALAVLAGPDRLALLAQTHRRFFLIVWHAMPITLLSGYALLFGWYGGFAGAGVHVHIMHLTGLIMSCVFVYVALVPWRAMRTALAVPDLAAAAAANDRIRKLVTLNMGLGLLTVIVAAWGRFGG
ncbi:putative membrane protein [Humitalea rosea]|uniref:Putative membrane protein n=1 Tax=Humitalea rosea TaxID=990373 RepID=A0A2W7JEA2_9PROT|nr:CopD family protein [Humitalea rosea]PZW50797.1 putative membrane protein [Humitalea rosea]